MNDFIFQVVLSNVFLSALIAVVALVVGATTKRHRLVHLLWLLVIIKLVTLPIVTIPVATIPDQFDSLIVSSETSSQLNSTITGDEEAFNNSVGLSSNLLDYGIKNLLLIWGLGSLIVFTWSLIRIWKFNRLLGIETKVGPHELHTAAGKIASRFGLKTIPTIFTTSAHLSPMVWWMGGKVKVIIPSTLLEKMETRQFYWILAHELAHVSRRDYLVRWLEWFASVCFWWNPVMWWARYNLRANEELCCDSLVVASLNPKPQIYADSLLKAVELLVSPVRRQPAMASEINSGGFLKKRFTIIVSNNLNRSNSRWLVTSILLCAIVVLPLGFACQQGDAVTDSVELTEDANLSKDSSSDRLRGGGVRNAEIEDNLQADRCQWRVVNQNPIQLWRE